MQIKKNDLIFLLSKVADGDEISFTELFELYNENINSTVLRITGDKWTAQEVLQDVFVKVWIKRALLPTLENFEAWLYTIAKNMTYDVIKASQRQKRNFVQHSKDSITLFYPEADYLLQEKEFQGILSQAVERLPEKQKIAYKMIKEQDLRRDQAAAQLGISPETVKSNLDHAMRSIRAYCVAHLKDLPLLFIFHFFSKYL